MIETVIDWQRPKIIKEVHSFRGLSKLSRRKKISSSGKLRV